MERLKKIIVAPQTSVKQALKSMDAAGEKILFVVNGQRRLVGTVTDGDIRRWILKKKSMTSAVSRMMNTCPVTLPEDVSPEVLRDLMLRKRIDCIPLIKPDGRIASAVWWMDLFRSAAKRRKKLGLPVVIMAGGEGSRLAPFTKVLPKPLIPVGEKPIMEIIVDRFLDYGCRFFYVSVNYKANILKAYFNDCAKDCRITFVAEDRPLGTIGSLSLLRDQLKGTFFVTNCDILIDADYADIVRFHEHSKNLITLVVSLKHYTIPYGVCEISDGGGLRGIREKPEYDYLVNTGMYLIDQSVLADIPRNVHFNMTDLIGQYVKSGRKVGVYPVSENSWLDMGELQELHKMLKKFEVG